MELGIIGTSIWQQNMPLMERLTIDKSTKQKQLQQLMQELGLSELIYLSTCNRVEFIYVASEKRPQSKIFYSLLDFFFRGGRDINFFPNDFFQYSGKEAISHLFRLTSSLESLVVGETQITGQFKQSLEEATQFGTIGPVLESLSKEALLVARKVKRETSLGDGALSMASLAANELRERLKDQTNVKIALVGAGAMTSKIAAYINEWKIGEIIFVNRTHERAVKLAAEFGGTSIPLEEFKSHPVRVSAIFSATSSVDPVFDKSFLESFPHEGSALLCIDLAVPRDFSLEYNFDERVKLVDIPYLKSKGNVNLRQKFVEVSKANDIVRDAVSQYLSTQLEVSLKPIFYDSYQESVELAKTAFNDLFNNKLTDLKQADKDAVMHLVTKLIGHSAFQPAKKLSGRLVKSHSEFQPISFTNFERDAV